MLTSPFSAGVFDVAREEWPQYVERLGHFFEVNRIEDEGKKRSIFLMMVGPTVFKLIHNLASPAKPGDKSCGDSVKLLTEHYRPTPSETFQRFKFHSRSRKPGESVANFVAELRALAEFCNFGSSLEAMLWDQIVCSISDGAIQCRLLGEVPLSLEKALQLAQGMETAVRNVKELQGGTAATPREVNQVTPHQKGKHAKAMPQFQGKSDRTCFCCGKPGHVASKCRSKDAPCHQEDGSPAGCVLRKSKGISQEVRDIPLCAAGAGTG